MASKKDAKTVYFPDKPKINIPLSALQLHFRDFAKAHNRKPSLKIVMGLMITVVPAVNAEFSDMAGISGDTIRGMFLGIVLLWFLVVLLDVFRFLWSCIIVKDGKCETNPDKKVANIRSSSRYKPTIQ